MDIFKYIFSLRDRNMRDIHEKAPPRDLQRQHTILTKFLNYFCLKRLFVRALSKCHPWNHNDNIAVDSILLRRQHVLKCIEIIAVKAEVFVGEHGRLYPKKLMMCSMHWVTAHAQ